MRHSNLKKLIEGTEVISEGINLKKTYSHVQDTKPCEKIK